MFNAKIKTLGYSMLRARSGLATTESAFFILPVAFATLAIVDLGRAGADRMQIDQALRAGAQVSMINITDETEVLNATLAALGESESGALAEDGMCTTRKTCITATYQCECVAGTPTTCASLCVGSGEPPAAYLTIVASRRQEGIFFPDYDVASSILVQTR